MSDIAIHVEGLSKQYRLGQREPYKSLRDVIMRAAKKPLGWLGNDSTSGGKHEEEYFWALNDISFEVKRGEAIGIIGRNGAGKSTLLKILSRITKPTQGTADIYGRVGSLLEVGTGFHPELTGRENIYLNGAILGMRRHEIAHKFDEIVDFSGVEKYLDMPVKRYSSGMYVRLAFAVAAHLEPEILLVDEVLAVGDAEFQKKCLGKMGAVAGEGRTVLYVSHNMTSILNLCQRSILINSGSILMEESSDKVIDYYLEKQQTTNTFSRTSNKDPNQQEIHFSNLSIDPINPKTGNPIDFIVEVRCSKDIISSDHHEIAIGLLNTQDSKILQIHSKHMNRDFQLKKEITKVRVSLDNLPLSPGNYHVNLWLGSGSFTIDYLQNCFSFTVDPGFFVVNQYVENLGYPVLVKSNWELM